MCLLCFCFYKNFNFDEDIVRIRMEIVNSILNFIVQGRPLDRDGEVSFLELTLDTLPAWWTCSAQTERYLKGQKMRLYVLFAPFYDSYDNISYLPNVHILTFHHFENEGKSKGSIPKNNMGIFIGIFHEGGGLEFH